MYDTIHLTLNNKSRLYVNGNIQYAWKNSYSVKQQVEAVS